MTILKSAFAGAAASALLVAQTAGAAPVPRAGSPAGQSEELGGLSGAAPVILVISIFALAGLVALIADDDEEIPTSP